jgi:hypothetical protein
VLSALDLLEHVADIPIGIKARNFVTFEAKDADSAKFGSFTIKGSGTD